MSHLVTPFLLGSSRVQKRRIRFSTGTSNGTSIFISLHCLANVTLVCLSHAHNVVRKPGLRHSGGLRGRKTGLPGEACKPGESGGGQAEGQVPRPGPEARRPRLSDEETTERAKVLRLGRLQHGHGQGEKQAASRGGARQEPGDWRTHSHAAGPAPEEVLLGDKQASRLASTILEAPSPPWGSRQMSLLLLLLLPHVPNPPPSLLFPFSSPGTTGFNMSGRVV